jgi:hypothetical protein
MMKIRLSVTMWNLLCFNLLTVEKPFLYELGQLLIFRQVLFWKSFANRKIPNVIVEWLMLLLRIWEVQDSNISQETGYPVWGFHWFFSVPPGKFRDSTLIRPQPLPSQFIAHLSPFHSTLSSLSYRNSIVKWTTTTITTTPWSLNLVPRWKKRVFSLTPQQL